MNRRMLMLAVAGIGGLPEAVVAQEKPVVAMIGTGNLAAIMGPAIGRAGYTIIYGSRDPARDSVRAIVQRSGPRASATTSAQAAARAQIVILGVPANVVESVSRELPLSGKVVVDVSSGRKRVAADGYLELVSDSSYAERLQVLHPAARIVRINLPSVYFFANPLFVGTRASLLIAGNSTQAKEAVARLIFDTGLDPHDAGPLRYARVFDAVNMMNAVPLQQRRDELHDLRLLPSTPWSCFFDAAVAFGYGRPYDLDSLSNFPRREPRVSCEEWRRRVGM